MELHKVLLIVPPFLYSIPTKDRVELALALSKF